MVNKNRLTAEEALEKLAEGNTRFAGDSPEHPNQSYMHRESLIDGQSPFALVVGCSDSRIPPEIIFDCGIGDIFLIRTAGNVVDDVAVGSLEYAVEHLRTPLIVVLGHTLCGAVDSVIQENDIYGHLDSIADKILPSVEKTADIPGDHWYNAVKENTKRVTRTLQFSEPILAEKFNDGLLKIVGAIYDMETGLVDFL
jgi:carbonic anhydrase